MIKFAGRWITTFGSMDLRSDGDRIDGGYGPAGAYAVTGDIQGDRFVFRYEEPSESGEGWFELARFGQFHGKYRPDGADHWHDWNGQREWDGIWDTSFGRMRLIQEPDRVHGFYDGVTSARIEGRLDGNRFIFRYFEPNVQGEGAFELSEDLHFFHGDWHPDGSTGSSGAWSGQRITPKPNLTWLMVFEVHWQHSLAESEYSYGVMLKEFFARLPNVAVRQRFFNDETSLRYWMSELMYIPEPAIVLISSHGEPKGVAVHGQTIDTRLVIECLRGAENIRLLHFAACLMLKEENAGDLARRIPADVTFPISGYTTSVDWGGSAVSEFSYFDMILSKGLTPEEAADRLPKLITYTGDETPPESPYHAAGFRFIPPGPANKEEAEKKSTLWASLFK